MHVLPSSENNKINVPESIPAAKIYHLATIVDIKESRAFPAAQGRALVALQQHKSSNALHHLDQVVPYVVFYKTVLLVEIHQSSIFFAF